MSDAAFPDWIVPMAATLTQERFTGPDWLFERKLDGIRLLAYKRGQRVRLLSRNKLPQNAAYPEVEAAISELPASDAILDGEATGVWGRQGAVAARTRPGGRAAVGARVRRGLGGRHRQAPRLAVRAPPLTRLAEDEV